MMRLKDKTELVEEIFQLIAKLNSDDFRKLKKFQERYKTKQHSLKLDESDEYIATISRASQTGYKCFYILQKVNEFYGLIRDGIEYANNDTIKQALQSGNEVDDKQLLDMNVDAIINRMIPFISSITISDQMLAHTQLLDEFIYLNDSGSKTTIALQRFNQFKTATTDAWVKQNAEFTSDSNILATLDAEYVVLRKAYNVERLKEVNGTANCNASDALWLELETLENKMNAAKHCLDEAKKQRLEPIQKPLLEVLDRSDINEKTISAFQDELFQKYINPLNAESTPVAKQKYDALTRLKDLIILKHNGLVSGEVHLLDVIDEWKNDYFDIKIKGKITPKTNYEIVAMLSGKKLTSSRFSLITRTREESDEKKFIDANLTKLRREKYDDPQPQNPARRLS